MLRERRDNELQQEPFRIRSLEKRVILEDIVVELQKEIEYHEEMITQLNIALTDCKNQIAELEGR